MNDWLARQIDFEKTQKHAEPLRPIRQLIDALSEHAHTAQTVEQLQQSNSNN